MKHTSRTYTKPKPPFEGTQLKRVSVTIQYRNQPETTVMGYALAHEILENQVSFFSDQKFPLEKELNLFFSLNGEKKCMVISMKHMHEQISSGRIMNALPTEGNPFPARTFYRCYAVVVNAGELTDSGETTNLETAPAMDAFSAEAPTTEPIPEAGDVAPVEMPAEEPKAA